MIILADVGNVSARRATGSSRWIEDGGVLVRFAGPRLAAADDDLVPVKLRRGGRILGGSLSWEQPQQLAAFSRESPFFGMAVPTDVTVSRQVLAEPDAGLTERTWATLADGTPLVTAATRQGPDRAVSRHRRHPLVRPAAVRHLRRHAQAHRRASPAPRPRRDSAAAADVTREVVPPSRILDGFGAFGPPPPTARPVPAGFAGRATADHPPGFYGPPEGTAGGEHAGARRPACATRCFRAQCAPGGLPDERTAGPARADPACRAGAAGARCAGGVLARGRRCQSAAAGDPRRAAMPPQPVSCWRQSPFATTLAQTRAGRADDGLRHARHAGDAARLRRHRRCRGRPHQQGRACRASRCSWRNAPRSKPASRSGSILARDELAFYPLIYWPIVPGAAKPSRGGARAHRRLHEARRHRAVRHPRRDRGAARPGRRDARPACWRCATSSPRSTSPSSSRCRATTC